MICPVCDKSISKTISNELRDGSRRDVFFCEQCELGVLDAKQSEAELKTFYATEYRQIGKPKLDSNSDASDLFNAYEKFQTDRINILKPYFAKNMRLLEFGCSSGMFLYHAKKYLKEIVGVDYDKASTEFASKKCNCVVYNGNIRETKEQKESFDIAVAFQTLEHVGDPKDFIEQMKEYTRKGGVIAIEVPNLYDALVHVYDLPYHKKFFYHKSHLWYFTEKSLKKLMLKAGIKGKVFHIQDYNVMNHINWILNDRPQPNNLPGLNLPTLPLRSVKKEIRNKLLNFFIDVDKKYKKILNNNKITSNILFVGKK